MMSSLLRRLVLLLAISSAIAFQIPNGLTAAPRKIHQTATQQLSMVKVGKNYEPKWKKKKTLADDAGDLSPQDKGLVGDITVIFKQGNETRTTLAMPGQPVSFVAAQAGQYIKYGCKKGECGTCEALCDGKWIRPCTTSVPELPKGSEYVVTLKEIKNKAKSSGKFYSFRSFLMGFYNNLLGMVGFVKRRRAAKKNWEERMEMEDLIRQKTLEKRRAREQGVNGKKAP
jgi:hypothetical protein